MATITTQAAHELTLIMYKLTQPFPRSEIYGLISQIRRCASSIGANIAEGFGRYHQKEKVHFLYNARGSLFELQNFMYLCKDLALIKERDAEEIIGKADKLSKNIHAFIKSLKTNL